LKARNKEAKYFEAELTRLSAGDPKILERLVKKGIDFSNIRAEDLPEVAEQSRASPQSLWG
jgi:hypothetical protein